jgi:hypothetical protein
MSNKASDVLNKLANLQELVKQKDIDEALSQLHTDFLEAIDRAYTTRKGGLITMGIEAELILKIRKRIDEYFSQETK